MEARKGAALARQESKEWSVYVLRCGDGTLYTGATNDVQRRLQTHLRGRGAAYTRSRLPVELIYREACGTRGEALRREAAIKRLSRAAKLALVEGWRGRADGDGD